MNIININFTNIINKVNIINIRYKQRFSDDKLTEKLSLFNKWMTTVRVDHLILSAVAEQKLLDLSEPVFTKNIEKG